MSEQQCGNRYNKTVTDDMAALVLNYNIYENWLKQCACENVFSCLTVLY